MVDIPSVHYTRAIRSDLVRNEHDGNDAGADADAADANPQDDHDGTTRDDAGDATPADGDDADRP